jgi:hypothetical protein
MAWSYVAAPVAVLLNRLIVLGVYGGESVAYCGVSSQPMHAWQ